TARAVGALRRHPAGVAVTAGVPVRRAVHHHRGRHRPASGTRKEGRMTATPNRRGLLPAAREWVDRGGLRDRNVLLIALILVLLIGMTILDAAGITTGRFN